MTKTKNKKNGNKKQLFDKANSYLFTYLAVKFLQQSLKIKLTKETNLISTQVAQIETSR